MILLPGPPNELIPMFHQDIFPYLNRLQPETIYSVMVKLCGVGESLVETEILDLIEAQENPTIANLRQNRRSPSACDCQSLG